MNHKFDLIFSQFTLYKTTAQHIMPSI